VISKTSNFDEINQGKIFSITMNALDTVSFNTFTAKPANTTNGAINDYTFTVKSNPVKFQNKDVMQIQMPNEVQLPAQV